MSGVLFTRHVVNLWKIHPVLHIHRTLFFHLQARHLLLWADGGVRSPLRGTAPPLRQSPSIQRQSTRQWCASIFLLLPCVSRSSFQYYHCLILHFQSDTDSTFTPNQTLIEQSQYRLVWYYLIVYFYFCKLFRLLQQCSFQIWDQ